ncbi:MAG: hypothetical protein EA359_17635 [Balneolaceae bacterium]|nr:MAG: hypothetical protein EA359_17635 [Balneolaceae bacterium]
MATGQTLLTLASIVLLGIISMSVRSMYVQSVNNTVGTQVTSDALNFGRDMAEEIHSFAFNYDQLDAVYGQFNDVTNPATRIEFTPQVGRTLYATIQLSSEQVLKHGQMGRSVNIRVFEEEREDEFTLVAEYITAVLPL